MEILDNPWITGIGGGIISSLIVFFLTRFVFNQKENKEYSQKIKTANNEILYAIRPLIVEKKIPESDLIETLKNSASQKFNVKEGDLFNNCELSNILVNEIMHNSFLNTDKKLELTSLIKNLKIEQKKVNIDQKNKQVITVSSFTKFSSALLAFISFGIALSMTFFISTRPIDFNSTDHISILIMAILIPLVGTSVIFFLRLKDKMEVDKGSFENEIRNKNIKSSNWE